jgi:hypothetical protein
MGGWGTCQRACPDLSCQCGSGSRAPAAPRPPRPILAKGMGKQSRGGWGTCQRACPDLSCQWGSGSRARAAPRPPRPGLAKGRGEESKGGRREREGGLVKVCPSCQCRRFPRARVSASPALNVPSLPGAEPSVAWTSRWLASGVEGSRRSDSFSRPSTAWGRGARSRVWDQGIGSGATAGG